MAGVKPKKPQTIDDLYDVITRWHFSVSLPRFSDRSSFPTAFRMGIECPGRPYAQLFLAARFACSLLRASHVTTVRVHTFWPGNASPVHSGRTEFSFLPEKSLSSATAVWQCGADAVWVAGFERAKSGVRASPSLVS